MKTETERFFIEMPLAETSLVAEDIDSFLNNTIDEFGFFYNNRFSQNSKSASEIFSLPGAILVAEGGMGKSYLMDAFAAKVPPKICLKIAIGEYCGNSEDLSIDLSNISDEISYIFIDGVDEAPDVIPTLLRKLGTINRDHIHLFIATRNIIQIRLFQKRLSLPVYSLLPLSQDDVLLIAKNENVEGEFFIDKVIKEGLSPICAKPQGCKALINSYKKDKLENISSEELWKESVLSLCGENDAEDRLISSNDSPCVPPEECFDFAAKIALILKFSGINLIYGFQEEFHDLKQKGVILSHFFESSLAPKINKILLRGIFTPAGNNCFKFTHISYFDYLAAIGLKKSVHVKHWKKILLSPDQSAVYPSWEGPASWLAAFDKDWCNIVLRIQPELLLVSDYTVDMIGAGILCNAILKRADKLDSKHRDDPFFIKRLKKLKKQEIIPVLEAALAVPTSVDVKEMAIDIIQECKIHELESNLVSLFCDPQIEHELRTHTGYALLNFAYPQTKCSCKSILNEENCSFDLLGLLFRMTWPNMISMREIEPHLTTKERHIIDAYDFWLRYDFPKSLSGLSQVQAKEVLEWAVEHVVRSDEYSDFRIDMQRQVFTSCWKRFTSSEFMELFAKGMLAFASIGSTPFFDKSDHETPSDICYSDQDFYADTEKRHRLAEALISMQETTGAELAILPVQLLFDTDVDFIFSKIDYESDLKLVEKWVRCLGSLRWRIPLPEMSQCWNDMHKRFPDIIDCDATRIIHEREKWEQECGLRKAQEKNLAHERNDKQLKQRIQNIHFIKEIVKKPEAYKLIPQIITFIMNEAGRDNIDYRKSSIWQGFSQLEVKQLALAARDFLVKENNSSFPRKGNNIYPFVPRTFFLVWAIIPHDFYKFPSSTWQNFAFLLFDCLDYLDKDVFKPIFEWMSRFVPDIYSTAMLEKIKRNVAKGEISFAIKYADFLDENGCMKIIRYAASDNCNDLQRFGILNALYEVRPETIKNFLSENLLRNTDEITLWGNCVTILVIFIFPDKINDFISHLLSAPPAWGKHWVEDVVRISFCKNRLISVLPSRPIKVLVDLYIWLHKNYPANQSPVHDGAFFPNAIDDVYFFINDVFKIIQTYSPTDVLLALRLIKESFPDDDWLERMMLDVKRVELQQMTPVYAPEDINCIIAGSGSGNIINSAADLLSLILELLNEYQVYLIGKECPRVNDLWNYKGNTVVSHKDEEHFSDHLKSFLKTHLSARSISINREVQLNRGINGNTGATTDIWIDAFSHCDNTHLSLCIEVKGSWNQETLTALDNQLIGKYMGEGGADAGILLVGWFQSKNKPIRNFFNNDKGNAEIELTAQEKSANEKGYLVKCVILDCPAQY